MAQLAMFEFDSTKDVDGHSGVVTELFSDSTTIDTDALPNYNSVSVQKYFPKKVGHTLLNGGFVTFTPNVKHRITMQFSFLTPAQYEIILNNYNNLVVIQPEYDTDIAHIPASFKDTSNPKQFKVLWSDDAIDFTYTDTYKGAGYSGTINWLEV